MHVESKIQASVATEKKLKICQHIFYLKGYLNMVVINCSINPPLKQLMYIFCHGKWHLLIHNHNGGCITLDMLDVCTCINFKRFLFAPHQWDLHDPRLFTPNILLQ